MTMNKQWAVVTNALVLMAASSVNLVKTVSELPELFLHLWWAVLAGDVKQLGIFPDWALLLVVVKCLVLTYRATSYHMPGVWAVTPPVCSDMLMVLPSLPRHYNTPSLEWINRLAAIAPFSSVCSSLCFILLHQLFRLLVLLHCKLLSVHTFFLKFLLSSVPLLSSPYAHLSLLSTFFSIHLTCSYLSNSTLAAAVPESIRVD